MEVKPPKISFEPVKDRKADEPNARVKKESKKEPAKRERKKERCPDCPWKEGLTDSYTVCPTCKGSGEVSK